MYTRKERGRSQPPTSCPTLYHGAAEPQPITDGVYGLVRDRFSRTIHPKSGRNAPHESKAKHQGKIAGALSGCGWRVFGGTWRSIAHDEGMRRDRWANQIVWNGSGAGELATETGVVRGGNSLGAAGQVSDLQPGEQSGAGPWPRGRVGDLRRVGVRAPLCGAEWELGDSPQPGGERTVVAAALPQVPVVVPLREALDARLHECPHPRLVRLCGPYRP
jgi:hypothetical protein